VLPAASEAVEEVPGVARLARSRPWLHPHLRPRGRTREQLKWWSHCLFGVPPLPMRWHPRRANPPRLHKSTMLSGAR
jgi:hypothetical protein